MNLFEINEQIRYLMNSLFENVDEETGEILAEDVAEALAELSLSRTEKFENIALYIKEKQAEADALKAEAKKLTERARVATNAVERLRSYLTMGMQEAGLSKFESARAKMSFRKSSALIVDDIGKIPEEYLKVSVDVDKAGLKKFMKTETVEGAHLEERQSLSIK